MVPVGSHGAIRARLMARLRTKQKSAAKPARRRARRKASAQRTEAAVLAVFAHDIRTALTGILALGELLASSNLGERERRWAAGIKGSAEHLASLTTPAARGRVKLTVTVADSGIGIARADIKRLFRPFAQASAAIARRYGGSGLGLAVGTV